MKPPNESLFNGDQDGTVSDRSSILTDIATSYRSREYDSFSSQASAPSVPRVIRPRGRAVRAATNAAWGLTFVLTIYALTGDDIRNICFDRTDDWVFDLITAFCIVVFTIEVVASSVWKEDYLLGFFFWLDVASTITLFLDLSWVDELLYPDVGADLRSSRTAKVGSRVGRVVRVLRLVRIVKVYKAIYEAQKTRRQSKKRALGESEEDDNWDDILGPDSNRGLQTDVRRESLVGKKLSELTTRRVIMLVLVMILALQGLKIDEDQIVDDSDSYGAFVVRDTLRQSVSAAETVNATDPLDQALAHYKAIYYQALLQFVYYHDWFVGQTDTCPNGASYCANAHWEHIFWVGVSGNNLELVKEMRSLAKVPVAAVDDFEEKYMNKDWRFGFVPAKESVKVQIAGNWDQLCPGKATKNSAYRLGFTMLVPSEVDYPVVCPEALRRRESVNIRVQIGGSGNNAWFLDFFFDQRLINKVESINSMLTMVFVCVALLTVSLSFANDANRLVLHPVETMIGKVETIKNNPTTAVKMADDAFKLEEMERAKENEQAEDGFLKRYCTGSRGKSAAPMETVILEKTIMKLGCLLMLGFGEVGGNIITQNMRGVSSAGVNAMVAGTKVDCIIGSTRIRDFSPATEVLQAKVMTFVNQIAEIVHGVVDEFHGAVNQNDGDTFLMVWRTTSMKMEHVAKLADMAMFAFARIVGAVHSSPILAAYRGHPGLQQRLGKNCCVTVSMGLHYGWAIEGVVGSEFKIDASYLSPNVSIAQTIERATQIYGVSVLAGESIVNMCTPGMASKCRLIDRVVITGSVFPMDLYCLDLDRYSLNVVPGLGGKIKWNSRQRFRARQFLEAQKVEKWDENFKIEDVFNDDLYIQKMRELYTLRFLNEFNMGYQNYAQGEWQVAERLLSSTQTMLGVDKQDGPSNALLRFMEDPYCFKAPEDWIGVRELGVAA